MMSSTAKSLAYSESNLERSPILEKKRIKSSRKERVQRSTIPTKYLTETVKPDKLEKKVEKLRQEVDNLTSRDR